MRASTVTWFALPFVAALTPLPARAADPVVAGQTNMGTHPSWLSDSAVWRTGLGPTLLFDDGGNTTIYAAKPGGTIQFATGYTTWMDMSSIRMDVNVPLFVNQPLVASSTVSAASVAVSSGITASSVAVSNGITSNTLAVGSGSSTAYIGHHPSYSSIYSGFWLTCPNCGTVDYSLLTEGYNTFVNAPNGFGRIYFRGNNADWGYFGYNAFVVNVGDAYKPGGGSWSATSDRRVKRDIADFRYGLAALDRVRPVTYRYNGLGETKTSDRQFVGVVAQELEPVLPFMVSSQKKKLHKDDKTPTDIKEVDPSAFTYVLINAVKELAEENREMKRALCHEHPTESFCTRVVAGPP